MKHAQYVVSAGRICFFFFIDQCSDEPFPRLDHAASPAVPRGGDAAPLLHGIGPVPRNSPAGPSRCRRPALRDRSGLRPALTNLRLPVAPTCRHRGLGIFSQIHLMYVYKRKLLIKKRIFSIFIRQVSAYRCFNVGLALPFRPRRLLGPSV